jgi:hypothetical protein
MRKLKRFFHHFFVPHHKNKYRAKALHLDALAVYVVLVVCLTLVYNQVKMQSGDILGYATDITVQKVYDLTNKEREKAGLPPLQYNKQLSVAAQRKAEDMFARNYWNHYGPDGTTPWEFIIGSGYQYEYAGENLAKNFMFSDGVVKAWMASPTHKENIVRKEYTEVGYAIVNGLLDGEETTLVVQMFGTPVSQGTNTVFAEENQLPPAVTENEVAAEVVPESIEIESGDALVAETASSVQSAQGERDGSSFFGIAYNAKLALLGLLFVIIAVDFYIGIKYHIIRVTGKNLAHLVFLAFIIAGVYLLAKGAII